MDYQDVEVQNLLLPALGAIAGASKVAAGMTAIGGTAAFTGKAMGGGAVTWGTEKTLDKMFKLQDLEYEAEPELENLAVPLLIGGAALGAKVGAAAKFTGKSAAGGAIGWGTEKGLNKMFKLQDLDEVYLM